MALRGNLRDFSATQLLNLINLARKTGTLSIERRGGKAALCFKEGKLVYAALDGKDEDLSSILRSGGKIADDLARTIQAQAGGSSDKELGLWLINAGYITQADIVQVIRTHILNNVYPIFTWPDGTFRFESNVLPFEDRITIPVELENVILEGSRRMKEWERLQDELPDLDTTLRFAERPDAKLRNINLSVEEWRVISFINPRNSIRQLAQYCNMTDFQIRRIVYGLLQAGLVEMMHVPKATGAQAPMADGQPMSMRRPAVKRGVVERLIKFFQDR
ncbi:MAG: DUF4388 domain-containing protein [Anaerolineales bacterium]|nr:MAG: DUF4388 domain-containing protein [Anaerolineales bacterium]